MVVPKKDIRIPQMIFFSVDTFLVVHHSLFDVTPFMVGLKLYGNHDAYLTLPHMHHCWTQYFTSCFDDVDSRSSFPLDNRGQHSYDATSLRALTGCGILSAVCA